MKDLPDWQKGWLAGMVDGEGCIEVAKGGSKFPFARVRIGMTHEPTIRVIAELTSIGSLHCQERVGRKSRKPLWSWEIASRIDVYMFLSALYSYFFTKAEHAEVALEYVKRRIADIPYTVEDRNLVDKIKKLNKRGGG